MAKSQHYSYGADFEQNINTIERMVHALSSVIMSFKIRIAYTHLS